MPPGATTVTGAWAFHGNGGLWAYLPADGTYVRAAGPDGGIAAKLPWVAWGVNRFDSLHVKYRRLDPPSEPLVAVTVSGSLAGYEGPSWASRMGFQAGCWEVTGRVQDMSLRFVMQVVAE